jgi:hypothetical protein
MLSTLIAGIFEDWVEKKAGLAQWQKNSGHDQ